MAVLRFAVLALALALPAAAAEARDGITVIGTGTATAVPDLATIALAVETEGKTAGEALGANSDVAVEVLRALADAGIEARDIHTSQLAVYPVYRQDRDRQNPPELTGYRVTNQVTVRVRDTARLGALIDEAVKAGANRVDSIGFGLSDPGAAENAARRAAVADGIAQARLLAEAAGVTLGEIESIRPAGYSGSPRPMVSRAMAEAAPPPIAEGEATISVSVEMVFELED